MRCCSRKNEIIDNELFACSGGLFTSSCIRKSREQRRCVTPRFKVGDRIHVVGVLASFYIGKTGVVIGVEPNPHGIQELDRYVVEIPGVKIGDTKFADFQLASAPHITRTAQLIRD